MSSFELTRILLFASLEDHHGIANVRAAFNEDRSMHLLLLANILTACEVRFTEATVGSWTRNRDNKWVDVLLYPQISNLFCTE